VPQRSRPTDVPLSRLSTANPTAMTHGAICRSQYQPQRQQMLKPITLSDWAAVNAHNRLSLAATISTFQQAQHLDNQPSPATPNVTLHNNPYSRLASVSRTRGDMAIRLYLSQLSRVSLLVGQGRGCQPMHAISRLTGEPKMAGKD